MCVCVMISAVGTALTALTALTTSTVCTALEACIVVIALMPAITTLWLLLNCSGAVCKLILIMHAAHARTVSANTAGTHNQDAQHKLQVMIMHCASHIQHSTPPACHDYAQQSKSA